MKTLTAHELRTALQWIQSDETMTVRELLSVLHQFDDTKEMLLTYISNEVNQKKLQMDAEKATREAEMAQYR